MRKPTRPDNGEGRRRWGRSDTCTQRSPPGYSASARMHMEIVGTRETPAVVARDHQPDAREGQAGPCGVTDRPVVVMKPGNAGGAKGPEFKVNVRSGDS